MRVSQNERQAVYAPAMSPGVLQDGLQDAVLLEPNNCLPSGNLLSIISILVFISNLDYHRLPILVGCLEHEFYFSICWECHHPN